MTAAWTADELERIGDAEELRIAPLGGPDIAIEQNDASDRPVTRSEHVTDEQYGGGWSA